MRSSTTTTNNTSSSSETISCQDCGNKAKRDCEHRRCRTCCKTRGLPCPTHVKSTWVPVSRRRQRQHNLHQHHFSFPLSLSTTSSFHHPILNSPNGPDGGNFPAEVNSMATFRCIRVSSEDNVVEQYAYQTSINIGGHTFKGILYDQGNGPTASGTNIGDQSSSAGNSDHHHPHHYQFSIAAASTSGTAQSGDGGGANLINYSPHPHLYSTPFNAFLPGMQFFPHPRP